MSDAILYIDISEVREGALDELTAGLKDLVDFIEANEPRLIAYNVYLSADGTRMTVVNVHPDSASLEYHMEVAGPLFRRFVDLVTLVSPVTRPSNRAPAWATVSSSAKPIAGRLRIGALAPWEPLVIRGCKAV